MNLKKCTQVGCLALAMTLSSAMAADNVGVVDMQKIFKMSPQIKAESAKLNKSFAKRRAGVVKLTQDLQAAFAYLQKNSAVMTKKQLAAKRSTAEKQEVALRNAQQKFQADVMQAQNSAMADFMKKARVAASEVAVKHNPALNVILLKSAVLYSKDTTDITPEVMKQIA